MRIPDFSPRRATGAFTLVELLTVIAIIGILAAILIPTIGAVKKAARESQSLSNLRQIAMAMNLYADDNKGKFAPGYYYKPGEGERIWTTELVPYIGLKTKIYIASRSPFVSPLAEIDVRDGSPGSGVIPSTYSVHGVLCPDISGGDTRFPRTQISRPTRVILVGESTQRSNSTYANATFSNPSAFRTLNSSQNRNDPIPTESDVDGVGGALRYRGRNSAPVAFVDGHVEALKKGTVTYGNIIADR